MRNDAETLVSANRPFQKGRLWALLNDGDRQALALIDSGATMSVLPRTWMEAGKTGRFETVETPFGSRQYPAFQSQSLTIAGIPFSGRRVLSADVKFPLIGADLLFSKGTVLFARSGVKFGQPYDVEKAVACVGLDIEFSGNSTQTAVRSVHFLLNIDGVERKVFFDTGRAPVLEGSSAPLPPKKPFPRIDVIKNMFGQWSLVPYYSRKASIKLAGAEKIVPYRHYFTDRSVKSPFILGARILDTYSIVVDHKNGRACFFHALEA
jgi:hypothetical protein